MRKFHEDWLVKFFSSIYKLIFDSLRHLKRCHPISPFKSSFKLIWANVIACTFAWLASCAGIDCVWSPFQILLKCTTRKYLDCIKSRAGVAVIFVQYSLWRSALHWKKHAERHCSMSAKLPIFAYLSHNQSTHADAITNNCQYKAVGNTWLSMSHMVDSWT